MKLKKLSLPWQGIAMFLTGVASLIGISKFVPDGDLHEQLMAGAGSICMFAMWFMKNPSFGGRPMSIPPPPAPPPLPRDPGEPQ